MKSLVYLAVSLMLPCTFLMGGVTGVYHTHGENSDQNRYTGTLTITKSGEVYTAEWNLSDGFSRGTGVRQGDSLAFNFVGENEAGEPIVGVQLYKISKGELEGPWSINGEGTVGYERDVKIIKEHHHSHSSSGRR